MLSFPMVHHLEYIDAGPLLNLELTIGPPFFGDAVYYFQVLGFQVDNISTHLKSFRGSEGWPSHSVLSVLSIGPPPQAQ